MNIKNDTIIRLVVLTIALINQALTSAGKNPLPFADEVLYEWLSIALTIGASIVAAWKNNSVTPEAIQADELLAKLKAEKKENIEG